jgi:hypothetical protein
VISLTYAGNESALVAFDIVAPTRAFAERGRRRGLLAEQVPVDEPPIGRDRRRPQPHPAGARLVTRAALEAGKHVYSE